METLSKDFMDGVKIVASNSDSTITKRVVFFKRLALKLEELYEINDRPFKINLCDDKTSPDKTSPDEMDFKQLPEFLENLDIFLEKCILIPTFNHNSNSYILYLIKPSHLDDIVPNKVIETLPGLIKDLGEKNKPQLKLV